MFLSTHNFFIVALLCLALGGCTTRPVPLVGSIDFDEEILNEEDTRVESSQGNVVLTSGESCAYQAFGIFPLGPQESLAEAIIAARNKVGAVALVNAQSWESYMYTILFSRSCFHVSGDGYLDKK